MMMSERHVMKCVERRSLGEIKETCGGGMTRLRIS